MSVSKDDNLCLESLISIFTVDRGNMKVLLMRKKEEPYKGYWILPGDIVNKNETIEDNVVEAVYKKLGLSTLYIEQSHTFSDINRDPDDRVIAVAHIGLIDNVTLLLNREERNDYETEWFGINDLPKLGYDHEIILKKSIEYLSKKIGNVNILKCLFPSDFTLPEIQKIYESLLNISLDRRNFRKKFINLGIIEETGDKNEGANGRPAKMYRLKDKLPEKSLF